MKIEQLVIQQVWIIENFNNYDKKVWHKGLTIYKIVDMITEKYKDINVILSSSWWSVFDKNEKKMSFLN